MAFIARGTDEGLSDRDIVRRRKRNVANEIFALLTQNPNFALPIRPLPATTPTRERTTSCRGSGSRLQRMARRPNSTPQGGTKSCLTTIGASTQRDVTLVGRIPRLTTRGRRDTLTRQIAHARLWRARQNAFRPVTGIGASLSRGDRSVGVSRNACFYWHYHSCKQGRLPDIRRRRWEAESVEASKELSI